MSMETTKKSLSNISTSNNISSSNMVLSRPNSSNGISIINLQSSSSRDDSNKHNNYNHLRGHSNHKFNNRNVKNNANEDIMLQRPVPIILAKPVIKDINGSIDTKDENQKPQNQKANTQSNTNMGSSKQVNIKLFEPTPINKANSVKNTVVQSQPPILANLSTNLTNQAKIKPSQQTVYQQQPQPQVKEQVQVETKNPSSTTTLIETLTQRLTNNTEPMISSVKLLDDTLQWNDSLNEYLCDQPDFLVIGILGKKGVGKSTLMSMLAGSKFESSQLIFKSSKDSTDLAQHKTSGINAFITNERTILLDVQPLMSGSVLDKTINTDKKLLNNDFKYYENYVEMQSIELACFILSVCNVVIVLEDWFFDPNLFRLLQTAEMLMPHSSLAQQEEYQSEHHPHLIYALNKTEYIQKLDIIKIKAIIDQLLHDSKLIYKGSFNLNTTNVLNIINKSSMRIIMDKSNVNLALIPKVNENKSNTSQQIIEYDGLASMNKTLKCLLREILSVKRSQSTVNHLNNTNTNVSNLQFSEKRWFTYANKVWETIRKSQLIGEYNRLMT